MVKDEGNKNKKKKAGLGKTKYWIHVSDLDCSTWKLDRLDVDKSEKKSEKLSAKESAQVNFSIYLFIFG